MNEIPEGFEIWEVESAHELKVGDRIGRLKIESNATTLGFVDSEGYWHLGNRELQTALAAANFRVLRKLPPPEPVVIECEIEVPYLNCDAIETYRLCAMLRWNPGKRFTAVLTEIQEPA